MATAGTGSSKLKILVMNTGGKASVEDRRAVIEERVKSVTPDVIFLQEANNEDKSVVGYAQAFGNDNASVMVQSNGESNKNVEAYRQTQEHMNNIHRMENGNNGNNDNGNHDIASFELSRVASCLFDGKVVCVSWHSRYTGISDGSKTKSLFALLDYIQRIKGKLPFILAGDFNIRGGKVKKDLKKEKYQKEGLAGLKLYEAEERYAEKVMVIASWDLVAQRGLQLHGQRDRHKKKRILDHLQLELEFSISSNIHLNTESDCVSDMLKAVLTHTVISDEELLNETFITREACLQADHLRSAAPIYETCVAEIIKVCHGYDKRIKRAHEIIDIIENIVGPFLKIQSEDRFAEYRKKIYETEDRVSVATKTIIDKLKDMFELLVKQLKDNSYKT